MPSTILDNVKGSDLPKVLADRIDIRPDKTYTVIIQPQEERQTLKKIMSEISRNAKARGMTPDVLEDIKWCTYNLNSPLSFSTRKHFIRCKSISQTQTKTR